MKIRQESIKEYESRIRRVLNYINDNLDKDLSLEILSREAYFSPYHFHRLFSALTGETPLEMVKRLKLEKAANLLVTDRSLSITDAALRCGFSSSASFARSFKEHFGCNATEWRESGFIEHAKALNEESKNCKEHSRNWKEFRIEEVYFSSVDNNSPETNLRRITMNVEIKTKPALHLAYVSHHEGYNSKIGQAFDKLCRWAAPRGLLKPDTVFLGISLDNPDITPADKCRYNACISVPENIKEEKGIGVMDMPELTCATYTYEGLQDGIDKAYKEVYSKWLPQSGYQPGDFPSFEIYLNDPKSDPERKFKLEVCLPVKPL
ncbi:MAG: AraC family transcriptional regulator [Ignavibacteria bacterium]|jgi:AraC family transcriptional regulator|nr:AraC family transcriptional regulator [Ignavibacteria bacterium]MCU7502533.1 AraC family transcriptional regulator [Ignavibacteria bacterium]MCU7515264.1 AraC family transcriptional regulator [Ignavibacteria bacterium]